MAGEEGRGEWISSSRRGAYRGLLSEHTVPSPVFLTVGGVVSSSRHGAYLDVLSEHMESSPVFITEKDNSLYGGVYTNTHQFRNS